MTDLSRRTLLSRGGVALGAGGLATVAGIEAAPASAAPASAAPAAAHAFTLHGSQLRVLGAAARQSVGDRSTVRGLVHERVDGRSVGELFATRTLLSEPSMFAPELGFLETHLFVLRDGTLTGSGTVHHDGTGTFTITGGTGRFAAAHGSYTSRHTADHSGTGEGRFHFTIG